MEKTSFQEISSNYVFQKYEVGKSKKYKFLKNGAMYSIFALGLILLADAFGFQSPAYLSPLITFIIIGYFFWKSKMALV